MACAFGQWKLHFDGLVPPATQTPAMIQETHIACFHSHVELCPVVEITLYYARQPRRIQVARVKCLPYPVLLGQDAPGFKEVLVQFVLVEDDTAIPTLELVTPLLPADSGLSDPQPARQQAPWLKNLLNDPAQLGEAQNMDSTLEAFRCMTAVSDRPVIDKRREGK